MALTEEQRQENIKTGNKHMAMIIGILGAYGGGFLGYAMHTYECGLAESFSYLGELFQESVLFNPFSLQAFLGVIFGLLLWPISYFFIANDYEKNKAYRKDEVAGTGGFMDKDDLKEWNEKYVENIKNKDEKSKERGYFDNMIYSENFFRSIDDRKTRLNNNLLVIGGAGTGKSRFVVKPNMLQMNASYVVTDPSGEILISMGTALKENGYKIKIFNISDMSHSNRYNPLEYIRNEAGVSMLIDCFIKNTTGKGSKGDEFFTNAERLLYSACIFYLRDFSDDASSKNMASVLQLVNASAVDENNANAKSPLDTLFDYLPQDSIAWKYYKAFKQAAGKTLKSIIISCVTRLQPFMTPQVANLTKVDNLELDKIGDEKTALFIITPQADRTYSFLASMLYSQLFETLYYKGEQSKAQGGSERMKYPVRCLMDEFANIGEVPEFPSKLSTMRKYNISATIILQDKSQIEAMYKDEWKTLVANCDNILYLGSSEPDTLKYMSEKLGEKTIRVRSESQNNGKGGGSRSFQTQKREVMTAEEIGRLPNEECLIYTRGKRPFRDNKFPYEKHPRYPLAAEDDKDPKQKARMFPYHEMIYYDTTKPANINSFFKASSEANRARAEALSSKVLTTDKVKASPDTSKEEDKIVGDEKKEKKFAVQMLTELEDKLAEQENFPVGVVKIAIPPRAMDLLLVRCSKKPCIIFNDIKSDDNKLKGKAHNDSELAKVLKNGGATVEEDSNYLNVSIPDDEKFYNKLINLLAENYIASADSERTKEDEIKKESEKVVEEKKEEPQEVIEEKDNTSEKEEQVTIDLSQELNPSAKETPADNEEPVSKEDAQDELESEIEDLEAEINEMQMDMADEFNANSEVEISPDASIELDNLSDISIETENELDDFVD